MLRLVRLSLVPTFCLLAGCGSDVTPILNCESDDVFTLICGMQNPEDLAFIPETDFLVVSQFGAMDGSKPGSLVLLNMADNSRTVVFPQGQSNITSVWGDPNCAPPSLDQFTPHGIDLMEIDGTLRLLVVNHGGRESVEFFEIGISESELPTLKWQGCVADTEDHYFNDVVNLSDGGYLVTHMMPKSSQLTAIISGSLGNDVGYVLHWSTDNITTKSPGTDAPFPNGIEISADENTLYLNVYLAGEVRKIDRLSGELLGTTIVPGPDNVTWSQDNKLLVASHVDDLSESIACNGLEAGSCGMAYEIVSIDPATMARETLFAHRGAPMGGVTVALEVNGRLYLGTFAGDRMAYIDSPTNE